jgi:hypothetical protein
MIEFPNAYSLFINFLRIFLSHENVFLAFCVTSRVCPTFSKAYPTLCVWCVCVDDWWATLPTSADIGIGVMASGPRVSE